MVVCFEQKKEKPEVPLFFESRSDQCFCYCFDGAFDDDSRFFTALGKSFLRSFSGINQASLKPLEIKIFAIRQSQPYLFRRTEL